MMRAKLVVQPLQPLRSPICKKKIGINFDVQVLDVYTNFKNTYNFDLSKKRKRSQFLQEGKNVNYEVR